jgi:hypothetical protein
LVTAKPRARTTATASPASIRRLYADDRHRRVSVAPAARVQRGDLHRASNAIARKLLPHCGRLKRVLGMAWMTDIPPRRLTWSLWSPLWSLSPSSSLPQDAVGAHHLVVLVLEEVAVPDEEFLAVEPRLHSGDLFGEGDQGVLEPALPALPSPRGSPRNGRRSST